MTQPQYLEAAMLLCFSLNWYWSIARMAVEKSSAGKSEVADALIALGYCAAIGSKYLHWQSSGEISPTFWIYVWNLGLTLLDLTLVVLLRRQNAAAKRPQVLPMQRQA